MNKLLEIRVLNNTNGRSYSLLGFRSQGDDRSGINVIGITLHDVDNRQVIVVDNPVDMRKYQLIIVS
jgi:hypothetical protein